MHPEPSRRRTPARRLRAAVIEMPVEMPAALPAALLAALVAALLVLVPVSSSSAANRAAGTTAEPLRIVLTSMSPSSLSAVRPGSAPLTLQGRVENVSQQTWRDINVSAVTSRSPITTERDLLAAADTAGDTYVGDRLADSFRPIGDLGPGDTASFILQIPRDRLGIGDQPGVYWVGVHALGTNTAGRDSEADGRARTFIPLVTARKPAVTVSVVLPFRQAVRRAADLALTDPAGWAALMASDGRLGRLLALTQSAGDLPVTLLLDPAVLEAAETVGAGNRAGAGPVARKDDTPATPSGGAAQSGSATAIAARQWLQTLVGLAQDKTTLALGYGDPDTAALTSRGSRFLAAARRLSAASLEHFGLAGTPAAAPPDGVLPDGAVAALDRATTVLLDDTAVTGEGDDTPVRRTAAGGQGVVLADSAAAAGGPAPGPGTSALAERQRILAEAAVRALSRSRQPLVVSLPATWDPGAGWQAAGFFPGLARPWLRLAPLDTRPGGPAVGGLQYPRASARLRLGPSQVTAANRIHQASHVYVETLVAPGSTRDLLDRLALAAVSYHARGSASSAVADRALPAEIRGRLAGVKVAVGVDLVTMSGKTGIFTVTLINDLDRPVRVGVTTRSAADLRITAPKPVVLPAHQRTTVRLKAKADATGVRAVTVSPVTAEGAEIGTPVELSVRSSQVSSLVWGVMAGAFALLLGTILRRAVHRGLRRETGSVRR